MNDDRFSLAIRAYEAANYGEAEGIAKSILADEPGNFRALNMLGMCLHESGRSAEAKAYVEKAIAVNPQYFGAYNNLAAIYKETGEIAAALDVLERALGLFPPSAELLTARAGMLVERERHEEAVRELERALALDAASPEALTTMGTALSKLGRHAAALPFHQRALQLRPDHAQAWYNFALTLSLMNRFGEALAACERALALDPRFAEAKAGRGFLLQQLDRSEDALAAYQAALQDKPRLADGWGGLAIALQRLGRRREAAQSFAKAYALKPDLKFLRGNLLHAKMQICDWRDFEREWTEIANEVEKSRAVVDPFAFLGLPTSPAQQLKCARIYVKEIVQRWERRPARRGAASGCIRLGYVSADFREHAVAHLVAGVFEHHDRQKFEVFAISIGRDDGSAVRQRIARSVEHFADFHGRSDEDIARYMRDASIDIAVDLTGFTLGARTQIFAARPAPVQVNYLGYAGTMGAEFMDYIVADEVVIPPAEQPHYAEKIAYLPDSYFASDGGLTVPDRVLQRSAHGLPDKSFVFCSFVNAYKITPDVFSAWMRILSAADASVLWLQGGEHEENLRRAAQERGVPAERLHFAPRTDFESYLAQHQLADLFLDTFHFNAHTTASHALWTGLPVLTCRGRSMAGRGGASILSALGLPELIARSPEEYVSLAIRSATDAGWHATIREKLAQNRKTHPLFDSLRYTRHLEQAYETMWRRHQAGQPPESFRVSEIP